MTAHPPSPSSTELGALALDPVSVVDVQHKPYTTGELPILGLAEPLPPIALRTILDLAPEVLTELVATARAAARELAGLEPSEVQDSRSRHPLLWAALADMLRFVSAIEELPPDRPCPKCEQEGRPPYPMSWIADDSVYFCPFDKHTEGP